MRWFRYQIAMPGMLYIMRCLPTVRQVLTYINVATHVLLGQAYTSTFHGNHLQHLLTHDSDLKGLVLSLAQQLMRMITTACVPLTAARWSTRHPCFVRPHWEHCWALSRCLRWPYSSGVPKTPEIDWAPPAEAHTAVRMHVFATRKKRPLP